MWREKGNRSFFTFIVFFDAREDTRGPHEMSGKRAGVQRVQPFGAGFGVA
jgi:hypothetical protein